MMPTSADRIGHPLVAILVLVPLLGAYAAEGDNARNDPVASSPALLEIFDEKLAAGAHWQDDAPEGTVHDSRGFAGARWIYLRTGDDQVSWSGLSLPIREHPEPGEYRYLSFAWRKWGGGQVALQIDRDPSQDGERQRGQLYGYRFEAGEGSPVGGQSLRLSEVAPERWMEVTRDLWQDFGDLTVTGLTLLSVDGRDAGLDRIYLARALEDLRRMPPTYREGDSSEGPAETAPILPARVTEPIDVDLSQEPAPEPGGSPPVILHSEVTAEEVTIDWWKQVMAGGWTMVALLVLSIAGVVIAVQRLLTVRVSRIAPPELEPAVRRAMASGDAAAALEACDYHPSTLAEALRFVVEHRHHDIQVVNQAAGDLAARDIRDHMSRIYPLSVIASLAPLLGLLGTIIGMIEAFALVSIYGDEGGATILSGSISKALITTAVGLIIAIPAIAVYYVIRNRLARIASRIEVALEDLIAALYLKNDAAPAAPSAGRKSEGESPRDASRGARSGEGTE